MSIVNAIRQKLGAGIGGSQAAAALGISPWMSQLKLWLILTGRATNNVTSEAAEWGQILEPVVRGYYAARNGHTGEHSRIIVPTESIYHPTIPWLRATPDGLIEEDFPSFISETGPKSYLEKALEVKCPSWRTAWQWGHPKARSVPPHYRIQGVVEMAVTGLPRVDFAVLIGGNDYFEIPVERDVELEEQTLEGLARFWHLVETDTPPDVDDSADWRAYFADRLPRERFEAKAAPEVEFLMDEWFQAHLALKAANERNELAKNRILKVAVDAGANRLLTDHGNVSVRRSTADNLFIVAPDTWGQE